MKRRYSIRDSNLAIPESDIIVNKKINNYSGQCLRLPPKVKRKLVSEEIIVGYLYTYLYCIPKVLEQKSTINMQKLRS